MWGKLHYVLGHVVASCLCLHVLMLQHDQAYQVKLPDAQHTARMRSDHHIQIHSAHGSNSDIRWSHQASWDFKPPHVLWVDETSNAGSPSEDVQPTKQLDMNSGRNQVNSE